LVTTEIELIAAIAVAAIIVLRLQQSATSGEGFSPAS
jgi:hypothetical protein